MDDNVPTNEKNEPCLRYVDPRIDIYEPTESFPYYRIQAYGPDGRRLVATSGGRSLRQAKIKAGEIAKKLHQGARARSRDPARVPVHDEVKRWLDPANHRTRENKPWSPRHAENVGREWELRIAPHIPRRATVAELDDKRLWVRILNEAQASGLAPASVQKTGQVCRSLISWLMDEGLLDRNPMRGVSYSMTKADNQGRDPKAVRPEQIPNFDLVTDLAFAMAWLAWPNRPGRGGNRCPDAVGVAGRAVQPFLVATTGLRNGELFALRPSHIDVQRLEVKVESQLIEDDHNNVWFDRPKHGSYRTVNFAGFLQDDLAALIEHRRRISQQDDPLLFCAREGGMSRRRTHARRFRAAARLAGWPDHLRWYGLRHLYAVTMLERLPLEVVSRLMGHHSPDFTAKRYLSLRVGWRDEARAAARRLEV